MPENNSEMYDTIIIGGGCAGLSAAMYSGRLGMKTLLLAETMGGTIILTDRVENYPGFKRVTGQQLADQLKEHALDYKEFVTMKEKRVTEIKRKKDNECFEIKAGDFIYRGKTLIYATGTKWRELKVKGHDEYKNKGVHYCALCDGFFYRGKTVAIVGGSDSAAKDALVMAEHAEKVYIIYRGGEIHPERPNMIRVNKAIDEGKIEIINNTNITEIKGDGDKVTSVILDKQYNGKEELELDGVFVAIGHIALSDLAKSVGVETNKKGEVVIDRKAQTNVKGFFAAGDVCDTYFKQAIVGVGEAVLASYGAYEYVNTNDIVCPVDTPEYE